MALPAARPRRGWLSCALQRNRRPDVDRLPRVVVVHRSTDAELRLVRRRCQLQRELRLGRFAGNGGNAPDDAAGPCPQALTRAEAADAPEQLQRRVVAARHRHDDAGLRRRVRRAERQIQGDARRGGQTLALALDSQVRPELDVCARESGWSRQQRDRRRNDETPRKNRQRDSFGCWLGEAPRSQKATAPPAQTIEQPATVRLLR